MSFKSLLCLRGYDTGRRFLAISLSCYGLFFLIESVAHRAPILLVLQMAIALPLLATASMRRIHDAGFATPLAIIPLLVYLLTCIGIFVADTAAGYWWLVLAVVATVAAMTISNARLRASRSYEWGYCGPKKKSLIDAAPAITQHRIEPTLVAGAATSNKENLRGDAIVAGDQQGSPQEDMLEKLAVSSSETFEHSGFQDNYRVSQAQTARFNLPTFDLTLIKQWINEKPKAFKAGAASITLIIFIFVGVFVLGFDEEAAEPIIDDEPVVEAKERISKIKLPDNFWIMLDQNKALTVAWQGDLVEDGELWSAITAKGDNKCAKISFGGSENYRSLQVGVKNQGDYYADFSPLDTKALVTAIAKKSRFELCGFYFSLKGTQAILMSKRDYAKLLTEEG